MRTLFYNYFLPYRRFFKDDETVETFNTFKEFRSNWIEDEECLIVIPIQTFDLIGLDIRFIFREYGRDDSKKFLLIGERKQIEFALSQNDKFIQNVIDEVQLPAYAPTLEEMIKIKINILKKTIKKG